MNKFEDLNGRFTSLGTGMTQRYKFMDRWRILLLKIYEFFLSPTVCSVYPTSIGYTLKSSVVLDLDPSMQDNFQKNGNPSQLLIRPYPGRSNRPSVH
jgi:hypothetical protein